MSGKLVTIASYDLSPLAELARLRLETAGIPVQVENSHVVNTLWHVGTALGGIRVNVPEEQAVAAHALIADIHQSLLLSKVAGDDDAPPHCLACGAEFPAAADRCPACGWSFSDGVEPEPAGDEDVLEEDRVEIVPASAAPLSSGALTRVRKAGFPVMNVWVAMLIASLILSALACVLGVLDDLFRR